MCLGYWNDISARSACKQCNSGFVNENGTQCASCDPGTSIDPITRRCTKCSPGRFGVNGQTCINCDRGTYTSEPGLTACTGNNYIINHQNEHYQHYRILCKNKYAYIVFVNIWLFCFSFFF